MQAVTLTLTLTLALALALTLARTLTLTLTLTLTRNIYDSDMALFLAVLHGHMGEDEILQQQAELETIANAMVDKKGNEASISIATGVQMLPKLFVTRRQQQLEELKD